MLAEIVKRLAQQFDSAQRTLNELRIKSHCDTFPEAALPTERRYEVAYRAAVQSLENRRVRANHFGSQGIFGEPAWDILLDLYIHQFQNDEVSVKSANFDSSAPASTIQRWFRILEDQNLIFSVEDPTNPRRCFIRLTPAGYESMTRYLNEIGR
jgi:DNA-binding MarR family transcriptional regulator